MPDFNASGDHNEQSVPMTAPYDEDKTPGPRWAHAVSWVPVLGWVGMAVIAWSAWRRRR